MGADAAEEENGAERLIPGRLMCKLFLGPNCVSRWHKSFALYI